MMALESFLLGNHGARRPQRGGLQRRSSRRISRLSVKPSETPARVICHGGNDAFNILKNIERSIAGNDLNAKFEQASQGCYRTAKELVVQSGVTQEGFGGIGHGLVSVLAFSNSLI